MLPPLVVSLGDPAGVGPELLLKAWQARDAERLPPVLVVEGADVLRQAAARVGLDCPIVRIDEPGEATTHFARGLPVLGRPLDDRSQLGRENVGLNFLELARDRVQRVAQRAGLQHAEQERRAANLRLGKHQARIDPSALDGRLDVLGQVADRCRSARQPLERVGEIARKLRGPELETPHDAMDVAVLRLQDLLQPMRDLDIGVAAQLADDRCALERLVKQRIKLSEQSDAADFRHGESTQEVVEGTPTPLRAERATQHSQSSTRSPASDADLRVPIQVVQPRRDPCPSRAGGTSSR